MPFFAVINPRSVLNVIGFSVFSQGKISNDDKTFDRINFNSNSANRLPVII